MYGFCLAMTLDTPHIKISFIFYIGNANAPTTKSISNYNCIHICMKIPSTSGSFSFFCIRLHFCFSPLLMAFLCCAAKANGPFFNLFWFLLFFGSSMNPNFGIVGHKQ